MRAWFRLSRRLGWLLLYFPLAVWLATSLSSQRASAQSSSVGQWSAVQTWPVVAVHAHLLPTGKVMFHPYSDGIRQWDPADGTITSLANCGYNLFCSGHSYVSDGRLFVTGGHIANNVGLPNASYYNPFTNSWTRVADMNAGRWYPTNTTLANGDVLVVTGDADVGVNNDLPQVWQVGSGTWRSLTNARLVQPLYARMFLAPNGQVFFAHDTSRYLNTSGTGSWTTVGSMRQSGRSNYGSAVMYEPGKIMAAGGADPPVASAEVIDLNASTPAWSFTGSMATPRRQLNLTILPDGRVLATGGSSGSGFNNSSAPVHSAEVWNPATGSWTTWASCTRYRGYHSTALLLPDGRVLCAGGDNEPNAEVFSPPYLFSGTRPTISSAPSTVNYGQTFFLGTPDATSIAKISFIRLGSVTHAFNQNQRLNWLTFSQTSGGLHVTVPSSGNLCPPGHSMLFLLNGSNIPSVAKIIRIHAGLPSPWRNRDVGPVAIAGSASYSGGTFTVTGSGADIWSTADEFHFV